RGRSVKITPLVASQLAIGLPAVRSARETVEHRFPALGKYLKNCAATIGRLVLVADSVGAAIDGRAIQVLVPILDHPRRRARSVRAASKTMEHRLHATRAYLIHCAQAESTAATGWAQQITLRIQKKAPVRLAP